MKYEVKFMGIPVMSSELVDKDYIYLLNRKQMDVFEVRGFKPKTSRQRISNYLKNLWKAVKGRV